MDIQQNRENKFSRPETERHASSCHLCTIINITSIFIMSVFLETQTGLKMNAQSYKKKYAAQDR